MKIPIRLSFAAALIAVTSLPLGAYAQVAAPVTPTPEATPTIASEPFTLPTPPAAPASSPAVTFEARAGRGITVRAGDAYSLQIRPRVQMRDTLSLHDGTNRNQAQIRTMRLWMTGHVIHPNIRYGIQLAFGGNDFDTTSPSPIFDAFVDFHAHRDLNVKLGQYFVPFDRMRTVREAALQTVDRAVAITQITLDRDIGATFYSDDLGGHSGHYAYQVGIFNGEGRNRFDSHRVGFLYTARFTWRPFGAFDDDSEGDLERGRTPRLAVGVGGAYNQHASRLRSTTGGDLTLGTVDYLHGALDLAFKYRGFAMLAEAVVRGSVSGTRNSGLDASGNPILQVPSRAMGYAVQLSYVPVNKFEVWARWDEIRLPWTTDNASRTLVASSGRELGAGVNYYLNNHQFKLQLDCVHAFGTAIRHGTSAVHFQLDATF